MSVSIPNIPFGEAAVCIAEERTVAITGLPLGTMWRDVSWQMEYCGEVAHYQAFEDTSVPGDILFVVMFTEEQAATDAMLMCDTDVNGHIMTVSPVKVSMKPVTLDDMKLDLAEKVQPLLQHSTPTASVREKTSEFTDIDRLDETLEIPKAVSSARERLQKRRRKEAEVQRRFDKRLEKSVQAFCKKDTNTQLHMCAGACLAAAFGVSMVKKKSRHTKDAEEGFRIVEGELRKLT